MDFKRQTRTKAESTRYAREVYRKSPAYLNRKKHFALQSRNNTLKREFGITLNDYNKMFQEQQGCCKICNKHQSNFKKALHVDHDHITNKIRALLCVVCNTRLTIIANKEWCVKASLYLQEYQ